jgi:tRNA threonylcarbamoyladenosine biosynthesis protein TsaE
MRETLTIREEDLAALAERVIFHLSKGDHSQASIVLLEGDLGAGKTTFTQALATYLGVSDHVHSPTFILKKEYKAANSMFTKVVHVDAYRFTHPQEAKVLRLEDDLKDSATVVVIEWPSKMSYVKADMILSFAVVDDDTREVTLTYEE